MDDNYLSISAFAQKAGIKRKTLIYYDQIDLLKPQLTSEKGYRYYHYHQLYTVNMIRLLKETGMSLAKIKEYQELKAPATIIQLLQEQRNKIIEKQNYYHKMEKMVASQIQALSEYEAIELGAVSIAEYEETPLFLMPGDKQVGRFSASISKLYQLCASEYDFPFPPGMMFAFDEDRCELTALTLYAKVPNAAVKRPQGRYLQTYSKGFHNFTSDYQKLLTYAQTHQLQLAAKVYLDVVLNELVSQSFEDFYLKMLIQIT